MLDTATRLSMLQERYKSGTMKIFIESLNDALESITGKLVGMESHEDAKRLIAIKKHIENEINSLYGKLIEPIKDDMKGFAELEYEGMYSALNENTKLGYAFASLPASTMKEVIKLDQVIVMGERAYTIKELFDNAKTSQINNYKQIISAGLASNEGYASIVRRLKGANAKATSNMFGIIHTSISRARDVADQKAYKDFDDVITGWESVSVLDSRTSLLCASLDGRMYYKKKGYPNYTDIPNRPPRHFRCRSRLVPRTDFKTKTTRAENGDSSGQIDAKTNFEKWFGNQSESFKENYLGKGRYELYSSGRLKVKDFIDIKSGETFTLAELRKKFPINKPIPVVPPKTKGKTSTEAKKPSKRLPKAPEVVLGHGAKWDKHVKDVRDEAKYILDRLDKPRSIVSGKGFYVSTRKQISTPVSSKKTFLHEYGHFIDNILGTDNHNYISKSRLWDASIKDAKALDLHIEGVSKKGVEKRMKKLRELHDKWFFKEEIFFTRGRRKGRRKGWRLAPHDENYAGFSDIIDSMSDGWFYDQRLGWGHGGRYFYGKRDKKMTENFANLFQIWSMNEKWDEAKELFPNLTKEFESIMEDVLSGNIG